MTKFFFILAFFALSLGSAHAQTADETAIRTVIESESKAFHTNADRSLFTTYWQVTTDTRLVYSSMTEQYVFTGKEMQTAMDGKQFPPVDNAVCEYSNMIIRANGTVGWASFDQKSTMPDGKVSAMREFRMMEKIGDAWKIVCSSVQEYKQ